MWQHILRIYPIGDVLESMQMYEMFVGKGCSGVKAQKAVKIISNNRDITQYTCSTDNVVIDDNAEFTFFISLKEDIQEPFRLYCAERDCILENLFADKEYVAAIVELFERDSRLGVLIPPVNTFGKIKYSIRKECPDATLAERIIQNFDLKVPMKQEASIHIIHAFWCRSSILSEDLINELKNDNSGTVMQMMPLFAQQRGYYTKILINQEYVAGYLMNMQGLLRDIFNVAGFVSDWNQNGDMNMEQMQNATYRKKITEFINNKEHVYIYGAGQLACRTVKIMCEIRQPDGIIVSDTNGNANSICGCNVMCADEVVYDNCSVIVAVGKKNSRIIEEKIKHLGVQDYLVLE